MPVLKRWLPVVAWSAVILMTSNDSFSATHTGSFLSEILGVAVSPTINVMLRKLAHLAGYGILGALAWRAARVDFTRPIVAAFAVVILVASLDEWQQSTVPSRGGSAWDVLLDVVGAAIAIGLMMRWKKMRALVIIAVLLLPRVAEACSCVPASNVESSLGRAAVVFAGVVEKIDDPGRPRWEAMSIEERRADALARGHFWGPQYGRRVKFRVLQWWKGEQLTETVEVFTGYSGGDCGYPVEEGQSFLVYANRNAGNHLEMAICGRTAALVCAIGDVEELGEPLKVYERFDRKTLIAREQPYTSYWRPCIEPALLLGERGLSMNKHCSFIVDGIIDRDGTVQNFRIVQPGRNFCPAEQVMERVKEWRFRPATIDGKPIQTRLSRISMREPVTESEYKRRGE